MNKLLLPENPIAVLPTLATIIGLNEAIALQQLHYWLIGIPDEKKYGREKDGKPWVYNNYEEWQVKNFPFWSVSTIRRVFASLEKSGLVISEIENNHRLPGGKRKWYTINYDEVPQVGCVQDEHTPVSKMNRPSDQNGQALYTETTTETTADKKDSSDTPTAVGTPDKPKRQRKVAPAAPKPPQPHVAIIDAWYDAMPASPIERKYARNAAVAAKIRDAGYTPEQVGALVREKYAEGRWPGAQMPLEKVADDLPLWIQKHQPPAPIDLGDLGTDADQKRRAIAVRDHLAARMAAGEFNDPEPLGKELVA